MGWGKTLRHLKLFPHRIYEFPMVVSPLVLFLFQCYIYICVLSRVLSTSLVLFCFVSLTFMFIFFVSPMFMFSLLVSFFLYWFIYFCYYGSSFPHDVLLIRFYSFIFLVCILLGKCPRKEHTVRG